MSNYQTGDRLKTKTCPSFNKKKEEVFWNNILHNRKDYLVYFRSCQLPAAHHIVLMLLTKSTSSRFYV